MPPYIRAASGIRRWQRGHVVVQDDVNALAFVNPEAPGEGRALLLPRGEAGRRRFEDALGNKAHKLDLEAVTTLPDGRLLVLGSGSTPLRNKVVLVDAQERATVLEATALYAEFSQPAFAGSQLNIEGALVEGDALFVFQRGNGAACDGLDPINAIAELPVDEVVSYLDGRGAAPKLRRVTQVDLGALGPAALGFTDVALAADGKLVFLACAEASPDVVRDGDVLGNCFGWFDEEGINLIPIVDEAGGPCRLKLEGLDHRPGDARHFDVVVDTDDASSPAGIGLLEVLT